MSMALDWEAGVQIPYEVKEEVVPVAFEEHWGHVHLLLHRYNTVGLAENMVSDEKADNSTGSSFIDNT